MNNIFGAGRQFEATEKRPCSKKVRLNIYNMQMLICFLALNVVVFL